MTDAPTRAQVPAAPEAEAPQGPTIAATPTGGNPSARRRGLAILALVVAIAAIGWAIMHLFFSPPEEETDDAYVAGDVVAITARDPGTVLAIHADTTQAVKAGADADRPRRRHRRCRAGVRRRRPGARGPRDARRDHAGRRRHRAGGAGAPSWSARRTTTAVGAARPWRARSRVRNSRTPPIRSRSRARSSASLWPRRGQRRPRSRAPTPAPTRRCSRRSPPIAAPPSRAGTCG